MRLHCVRTVLILALLALGLVACRGRTESPSPGGPVGDPDTEYELATFGGGCFWCTEAVFAELKGVESAESGYAGGKVEDPTYEDVCAGITGHAEVIQVRFDPSAVTYEELLEVFFKTHDPTTLNRQGADFGTQYRSIILTHSDEQNRIAEQVKKDLDAAKIWSDPIVTEIVPYTVFYPAEAYHQDYYASNPRAPYCRAVITPKLEKFRKVFPDRRR